jgi:pimeloyl-ACP methyl ester carboxylesterase
METAKIGNTEVRYEVRGDGDPVICLHANPFVEWYLPLIDAMPGYSFLRYTRRPLDDEPLTVRRDAATCQQLANHLGWGRAHIVGHSAGALPSLQLAIDAPNLVRTLCLLEPAVPSPSSDGGMPDGASPLAPILEAYAAGDYESAIERFLVLVCGNGSRVVLEGAVPGAFNQAVQACEFFFRSEVPSMMQYEFGAELAAGITAPVLNVVGERTEPGFVHGAEAVQSWLPNAERFVLPDASHLLMVEQPDAMATELVRFFEAHPTA